MRPIRALFAGLLAVLLAPAGGAVAQPLRSAGPDSVAVTIYRDPGRDWAGRPDGDWLGGYALVTETRSVTIPAGRAVIRFEGVAGGILPESAIVTGLPDGVREKNLDADLLSPSSLYAGTVGRPVTLRRTIGGRTVEERAILRSGPQGAAILETRQGFLAANCARGERDVLVYDSVPPGLSAKPTLSVETDSTAERRVTLTLSYLAWGFDWQADYVATMRPDGRSAELFAWVTLANSDVTSFADADTAVVAGNVERTGSVYEVRNRYRAQQLSFRCFFRPYAVPSPPAPLAEAAMDGDVVVTGFRASLASSMDVKRNAVTVVDREELGDLNLYRVPHRTTIASKSQKQVGLLDKPSVNVDLVYRMSLYRDSPDPVRIALRTHNRKDKGLGVPLPSGSVALFEQHGGSRLLVGEGALSDKAIGEEIEVDFARSSQVIAQLVTENGEHRLTITNANPFPVRFEAEIDPGDGEQVLTTRRLGRKDGKDLWATRVPANGNATLRYRLTDR